MLDAQNTFSPASQRSVRCWPVQIFTFWALSQQWAAVTIVFSVQEKCLNSGSVDGMGCPGTFCWTFLVTQNDTTTWPAVIDHKMDDPWPWIWNCLNTTYNSVTTILSGEFWWSVWRTTLQSRWYSLFCRWPCCKRCCFLCRCDLLSCCIGRIKIAAMPIWKILRIIQIVGVTSLSPMTFVILFSHIASENYIGSNSVQSQSQSFTCT